MLAVIYARYSSDNQREESITAQTRACREYAEKQGHSIVKIYTDEAKSAQTDDRPNFLRMFSDIKSARIKADVVLVHKLDRFARNRYDSVFYKRELQRQGMRVESVLEPIDESPESVILESVLEGMAEYYSKNLAREVRKGMKETALQGKHNGGLPPLGYNVNQEGRYTINELEAPAIRLIFEMYTGGHGYGDIIAMLNERGYKTKGKKPFGKNSLHDILKNKKYAGIYVFNRSSSKGLGGRRNNHLAKSSDDIIEIPGAMPAIIPGELFWRVQEKMNQNKRESSNGRYKASVVYLLSGLIWCGECSKRMIGTSSSYKTRGSSESKKLYYYECNYAKRTKECSNEKINKDRVEEYVISKLQGEVLNEKSIPALAKRLYDCYQNDKDDTADEGKYLEQEILKIEKQISNIVEAITMGAVIKSLVDQLKTLETQKSTLDGRLQEWTIKHQSGIISLETITEYLQYNAQLLNADDPMAIKQVLEKFVDRVVVSKSTIEVIFKITVVSDGSGPPPPISVINRLRAVIILVNTNQTRLSMVE